MIPALGVQRVKAPTPEVFLREFVNTRTPVVLSETATVASFAQIWDLPSVVALLGDREFAFKSSSSNAHPNFRAASLGEMFARKQMSFRQFSDFLEHAPPDQRSKYIFSGDEHFVARQREGEWIVNPQLAALWDGIVVPPYVPRARVYSVWSWFSSAGVRTWLHYDNNGCHNLNVQLHGEKTCTLLPPETLDQLDFFEPGQPVPAYNCSRIDAESTSAQSRLADLPRFEATIQAGDLLFIPAHWIHTFAHRGVYNANVNFWWKPDPNEYPFVDDNPVARREAHLQTHRDY